MTFAEALATTSLLFLDTAPVIYYVEGHPRYLPLVDTVFARADAGELNLITSPITLAECLVVPLRRQQDDVVQAFSELITGGPHTYMSAIDHKISVQAARLRAAHNLSLLDALQASVALATGCDTLLTNDPALKRVSSLRSLVLDDFAG